MRKTTLTLLLIALFTFVIACNAMAGLREDLIAYEPESDAEIISIGGDPYQFKFLIKNRQPGLIAIPGYIPDEVNYYLQPVELAKIRFFTETVPLVTRFYKDPDPTTIGIYITINNRAPIKLYNFETIPEIEQKIGDEMIEICGISARNEARIMFAISCILTILSSC